MSSSLSLEKGLHVLGLLKSSNEPLGVREVGRRLDLSPSVAQRMLNTLASQGYVEQDGDTRRYQIGYAVLGLAQHVFQRGRLLSLTEAELQTMASDSGFNGFLGVRRGATGVYVLAVQSDSPVVIRAQPGEVMPLHSTALGKALLFNLSDDVVTNLLGEGPFEPRASRTLTNLQSLLEQLHLANSLGYATAISENIEGVISVGAPIYDAGGGTLAAISVAFPRALQPKIKITDIAQKVLGAAARISKAMGFDDANSTKRRPDSDVA
ncbi:IclR family transcriptional regulator [Agrobacterium rosae]|uniref:IclR family transcriptional regulator n=1 Tax=Agrobacterium rosae TaxID=1972867 RepID=A0AAW9FL53_9HYPH|nr:IclR family transcriptional regulator [Agrobacterium rosae]MDX8304327.1 IclR family transcriptional regulator [Agrobacterium rosae]